MKVPLGPATALLVCCFTLPGFGQTEMITLYADAAGTDCSVTEPAGGLVDVYVFHVGAEGRRVSHFSAPRPACWTGAIFLGEVIGPTTNFLVLGSTQTDLLVGYPTCPDPPVHVATMTFWSTGAGQSCCEYHVLPAPSSHIPGAVIAADCATPSANVFAIGAGSATINETDDCLCNPPLAVEETTWGRAKAFYR